MTSQGCLHNLLHLRWFEIWKVERYLHLPRRPEPPLLIEIKQHCKDGPILPVGLWPPIRHDVFTPELTKVVYLILQKIFGDCQSLALTRVNLVGQKRSGLHADNLQHRDMPIAVLRQITGERRHLPGTRATRQLLPHTKEHQVAYRCLVWVR